VTAVLAGVRHRDALVTVELVQGDEELSRWTLTCSGDVDLAIVDVLARLQLVARRLGCAIRVRDADAEVADLLALVGLAEVVGLAREVVRETEDGEQLGPEEVVVPDDPVA
jgi:hypothetical protein